MSFSCIDPWTLNAAFQMFQVLELRDTVTQPATRAAAVAVPWYIVRELFKRSVTANRFAQKHPIAPLQPISTQVGKRIHSTIVSIHSCFEKSHFCGEYILRSGQNKHGVVRK